MMINFPLRARKTVCIVVRLTLCLMMSLPFVFTAEAGAKYKKSTTVDFEGALVEGKSRKPYSAYLSQQKESAFGALHRWEPDLDKRLLDSQTRLEKSQ